EDDRRRMGGSLPRGVAILLYLRPYPHDPAPRRADPQWPSEADPQHDRLVQADDQPRGRASARGRRLPPEIPPRPPPRAQARIAASLLPALLGRDRDQGGQISQLLPQNPADHERGP